MNTNLPRYLALILCAFTTLMASALSANPLQLINVTDNIYSLIGPMEQRSPDNLGNNANFGFIVSDQGVLLIDSGGTLAGAKNIEHQRCLLLQLHDPLPEHQSEPFR